MMKKNFLLLLILLLFVASTLLNVNTTWVSAVEYPAIYIDPATTVDPTLIPGSTYTISIYTDYNGTDIWGWAFTLTYNPDILQGVKVANGDLITTAKHPKATFIPGTINNTAGTLWAMAAFFFTKPPAPLTSGPGTLANVTFTVVGYGVSNITLGELTLLQGYYDGGYGELYDIINGQTMPDHLGHGYFDNRGAPEVHDVAVVEVTAAPNETIAGKNVTISLKLRNEGTENESVNVIVSYDTTVVYTVPAPIMLRSGTSETISFSWDTPTVTENTTYTITANATIKMDEHPDDNTGTTQIKLVARHDISVKDGLEAPLTAIVGENVTINVTFENQGSFDENVTVTVRYVSGVIGTKNFTLNALTSNTVSFTWNTTDLAPDTYKITAEATIKTDEHPNDNTEYCYIKLTEGHDVTVKYILAPTTVYVGDLVTIRVVVRNNGGYNETFKVKIRVSNGTKVIETQTRNVTLLLTHPEEHLFFNWTTTDVAPGSYTITAEAILLDGDVNPNDNIRTSPPIVLKPLPGTIIGTVTDASTDLPIAEANVTAGDYTNTTDAEGHYMITDVPPGDYNITASASNYHSNSTSETVISGETITVNFELTPLPGAIAGTVTDALTGDPIEGADVTANGYSGTTDTEGHYTIQLPPRTYTVTVSATKYVSQSKPATVTANTTRTIDFALTLLNGTISGTVTDSSTDDPIAGATVTANGISVSTGTDGTYSIELPPGTYNVTVSANGYKDSSQTNITVVAEETTPLDFELTPIQPLNILLYAGVAATAIIIIAAIAVYVLKFRKPT